MLKDYEIKNDLDKAQRKKEKDTLEYQIGALQRCVKQLGIPVIIVVDGWSASGKGKVINELMLPLDPRSFVVYNPTRQIHEIRNRPLMYDYWAHSPAKGQMVIFDSSYYEQVFARSKRDDVPVKKLIGQINEFENMLTADGTVIIKFFLNITKKLQRERLDKLKVDPIASWQASKKDFKQNKHYDDIEAQWVEMISETDKECAPWHVVDSSDLKQAAFDVLSITTGELEKAVKAAQNAPKAEHVPLITVDKKIVKDSKLSHFDKDDVLAQNVYKKVIHEYQDTLRDLEYMVFRKRVPVMIAFEGFDAAGKGGAIKRVAADLDPRGYRVYPSSAPNDIEKAHNWLWRYWTTVPKRGHFSIYDRTWYGRVLVEPIEGFCTKAEYKRAFGEIRDFEKQLTDFGTVLIKFWMNVSPEEQEARFKARETDPQKRWKITDEDWRNREKRPQYVMAAERMFKETSTKKAPWIIINGDDKRYARTEVLSHIIHYLRKALK